MLYKLPLFITTLYCLMLYQTASAQKLPKLPKASKLPAVSATTTKALTPSHQAALLHAQALRNIQIERSVATAVQEQLRTPPATTSQRPPTTLSATPASLDLSTINWHAHKTPQQWLKILETFVQQHGRLPKADLGKPEFPIFRGIRYTLSRLDPQDPIALRIQKIKQQYARSVNSPQQWLELLEEFVAKKGRWPSGSSSPDEHTLNQGIKNVITRLGPQDPIVLRINELKEQYPNTYITNSHQQWLERLEEFVTQNERWPYSTPQTQEGKLYSNIQNLLHQEHSQEPVIQRIHELRAQYPSKYTPRSPEQWLEELEHFIQQNDRFPSPAISSQEKALYMGVYNSVKHLGPQNSISLRINELKKRYTLPSSRKTPQQWLDLLEEFIAKEGRYPMQNRSTEERALQQAIRNCLQNFSAQDPVTTRMYELKKQYTSQPHRTEKLLSRLEQFVETYERFPEHSIDGQEDILYHDVQVALYKLDPKDPLVLRIQALQSQYAR